MTPAIVNQSIIQFKDTALLSIASVHDAREVDHVVSDHGTLPKDDLYFEPKERSRNRGAVDYQALVAGKPQTITTNPEGKYMLFRVGDAVASRNIHAALFDSLRLCKDF
jgi:dimethylglycine catabolism A